MPKPYEALRPPDTTTDDRTGQPFLRVPLANSDRFARISPQDHQRVLAAGFSPNWYLHLGYVTTYAKGRGHARVARIILGLTSPQDRSVWPAAGFVDTEIGCFMKPEVAYEATTVWA